MSMLPSKGRRSVFEMLDDPDYGKKSGRKPRGASGRAYKPAAAALDEILQARFEDAQRTTGLSGSDLVRQGLRRVLDEIERTGQLIIKSQP